MSRFAFAVGFGTMTMAMHAAAVSASLPLIMQQSHLPLSRAQLILTLYSFVVSCCLIVFGRVGDIVGFKPVFLGGLATVALASSLVCIPALMSFVLPLRVMEGAGAAMISGTSLALIASETETGRASRQIGWQTGLTYAGLAIGALFAIPAAQRFGWRIVFGANAFFCVVAFVLASALLSPSFRRRASAKSAGSGQRLLWVFPGLLMFAFLTKQSQSSLGAFLCNLAVLAGAAALLVIGARRLTAHPKDRSPDRSLALWGVNAAELNCYLCVYGVTFLMPLYLLAQRRVDAVTAGVLLCCQYLARSFAAVFSGRWVERVGTSTGIFLGSAIMALALLGFAAMDAGTPVWYVGFLLVFFGAGTGFFVPANSAAAVGLIHESRRGLGTGILATFRNAGMTLGVPIAAFVFNLIAGQSQDFAEAGYRAVRGAMSVLFALAMITACSSLWSIARARLSAGATPEMLRSMEDM